MAGYTVATTVTLGKARDTRSPAPEGDGKAMIGNHLLEYRLMKDHLEDLLAEGQQLQLARRAGRRRRRSAVAGRLSSRPWNLRTLFGNSSPAPLPTPGTGLVKGPARRRLPSLVSLERTLSQRLEKDARRRTQRLAQSRAIARFARSHTLWYESLFDNSFLRSLPEDFYKRSPSAVARSWAAQFPYFREVSRERDVERLEPVAKEFLQMLAEEEARLDLRKPAEDRERAGVRPWSAA